MKLITCQASVLAILVLIGCAPQKSIEVPVALQTISLESTSAYRTVRSIPLVSNKEEYKAGSEVLVVGEFIPSDMGKPVPIVRAEIRFPKQGGGWIIASSAGTANVREGRYELTIKAPEKSGKYELHVSVLDRLYIGRCEFSVGSKHGEEP